MIPLLILLLLCFSKLSAEKYVAKAMPRICLETSLQYNFVVAIFRGKMGTEISYAGGGTLLSSNWVLTSSSLFKPSVPVYTVVAGAKSIYIIPAHEPNAEDGVQVVVALQYFLSPETREKWDMRIALLRLRDPIQKNFKISYVRFATYANLRNTTFELVCKYAVIMGYGDAVDEFENLHCPQVLVLTYAHCQHNVTFDKLQQGSGCFYAPRKTCSGYEGGPLMCNGTQYGVLNNQLCHSKLDKYPSVFTKVHLQENFIKNTLSHFREESNEPGKESSSKSNLNFLNFLILAASSILYLIV